MTRCALVMFAVLVGACTTPPSQDPLREREIARVHAHLERVESELMARPVNDLTPAQRAARATALANLRAYIAADVYPTNDVAVDPTPIFIDRRGVRCAMASLIEAGGGGALVARVARDHDHAYIDDLARDPELQRWLTDHGITLREAARIQPMYPNATSSRWVPTLSAVLSAEAGRQFGGDAPGWQAWLSGGIRIGARRITDSSGACDRCVYGMSDAFVAEYLRSDVPTVGGTNELALLWQRDLTSQGTSYLLGGPSASVDGNGSPGSGLGAKVGFGMSFGRRSAPLFAELTVSELTRSNGAIVRAGLHAGLVW